MLEVGAFIHFTLDEPMVLRLKLQQGRISLTCLRGNTRRVSCHSFLQTFAQISCCASFFLMPLQKQVFPGNEDSVSQRNRTAATGLSLMSQPFMFCNLQLQGAHLHMRLSWMSVNFVCVLEVICKQ